MVETEISYKYNERYEFNGLIMIYTIIMVDTHGMKQKYHTNTMKDTSSVDLQ